MQFSSAFLKVVNVCFSLPRAILSLKDSVRSVRMIFIVSLRALRAATSSILPAECARTGRFS